MDCHPLLKASSKRLAKSASPQRGTPYQSRAHLIVGELSGLFIHEHEARKNRNIEIGAGRPLCGYRWSLRDRKQGVGLKTRLVA